MSAGTKVRTFRLSDNDHHRIVQWGLTYLGTRDFSAIMRHIIRQTVGRKDGS